MNVSARITDNRDVSDPVPSVVQQLVPTRSRSDRSIVMNRRLLIPITSLAKTRGEADARAQAIETDGGDA